MHLNLGCSLTVVTPHQYGSLLHTPGHMLPSPLLQGVASAGPGAGGGAELLAAVPSLTVEATAGEETVLGVVIPPHHQPGQLARRGDGGEEHLRGV